MKPSRKSSLALDPPLNQPTDSVDDGDLPITYGKDVQDKNAAQPLNLIIDGSFTSSTASLLDGSYDEDTPPRSAKTIASSLWSEGSPQTSHTIPPELDIKISPDQIRFEEKDSTAVFTPCVLPDLEISPMNDKETEEIMRELDPVESWLVPLPSPPSSDSSGSSTGSWSDALALTMYDQPRMHFDSEETLVLLFDRQTCGILSIRDGPFENPWRTMLWPLAREDGALRRALTSMTAFHASKDMPRLRIKGIEHMSQSLQLLSRDISSMPLITSLATTLVLAFCESWDTLVSSGIQHLRGASHLVAEIIANYRQGTTIPENEPCLGFLCKTWVYMSVIARLTSLEGDDSTDFDIVSTPLCQSSIFNHDMDPLMGCASTLFPTIGRVANIVRKVRQRTQSNSLQIVSQARDLKTRLEEWKPPPVFASLEDPWTEVEQGLRTAEAYRGATLLYLLQAVPEISYDSVNETIAALARAVLTHIANIPVTSGMVIIHIFPLLAAGCEAVDKETRAFVTERWQTMMHRMKIQNLDKCLEIVKEVWERRDGAADENQRRKARLPASGFSAGHMPTTIMKRKYVPSEDSNPHSSGNGKCQAIQSTVTSCSTTMRKTEIVKQEPVSVCHGLAYELTVRGRHHWAGVMKDRRWEGER